MIVHVCIITCIYCDIQKLICFSSSLIFSIQCFNWKASSFQSAWINEVLVCEVDQQILYNTVVSFVSDG